MVEVWVGSYIEAKYHLEVAKRMFKGHGDYEEKRFLIGVIKEMARSASQIIRAFLILEGITKGDYRKNLRIFVERVGPKYLEKILVENLVKILEIQRAQKDSPIEISKNGDLIFLINGRYRFLKKGRLKEFLGSLEKTVGIFAKRRQV